MIMPDSEILRLEKRQRGLQRVATAINDLTIYGIYPTNFPKLTQVLEHAKDHVKAENNATKKTPKIIHGEIGVFIRIMPEIARITKFIPIAKTSRKIIFFVNITYISNVCKFFINYKTIRFN